jgi:6-phosphofructokinase 1
MDCREILNHPEKYDFNIQSLGEATVQSPLQNRSFVKMDECISFTAKISELQAVLEQGVSFPSFEQAGARQQLFHDPTWSRAAIVTCGGLCPGLNDVIKGLVQVLWFDYGVRNIFGIPYGFQGLNPEYKHAPLLLNPDLVDTIHEQGGTILGTSRGAQDVGVMVNTLQRLNINMLFCIGGDGTLKGAHAIAEEIKRRKQPISVIGIPKTIDNDLRFTDKTFGFETAVYSTFDVITSAHIEARGAFYGVGLVRLMGRDSGFIAASACLANSVVNFCLIPEVPFELEGEFGLLKALERRFDVGKTHALIVVAEGAGQDLLLDGVEIKDASGNILKKDIGLYLKDKIPAYFKNSKTPVSIKYFDPSYSIRSVPAMGNDAIYCTLLAEYAVHASMSGRTDMVVGHWNDHFTHIPILMATLSRKQIDPEGALWHSVLGATRQNDYFKKRNR